MNQNYKVWRKEVCDRLAATGSTVPEQRLAFKRGYSFSRVPAGEQLGFWDHVWMGESDYRLRLQAFFYTETLVGKKEHARMLWHTCRPWQERVDQWSLCDCLAKIYTKVLEVYPEEVYGQLEAWNSHERLWMRRQSVVSLLYFSRTKKQYLPVGQITGMIEPLLEDTEYYVQKGVGWALRELSRSRHSLEDIYVQVTKPRTEEQE